MPSAVLRSGVGVVVDGDGVPKPNAGFLAGVEADPSNACSREVANA
jgi:hypothetical protein